MESQNYKPGLDTDHQKMVSSANPEEGKFKPLEAVEKALKMLKSRDRNILRERFGLGNGEKATLERIGKSLGITRERVRQLEKVSLQRLREDKRSKLQNLTQPLTDYIRERGGVANLDQLASHFSAGEEKDKRAIALLADIAPNLLSLAFAGFKEAWGLRDFAWEIVPEILEKAKEIFRKEGKLLEFDSFWRKFEGTDLAQKKKEIISPEWLKALLATSRMFGQSDGLWGLACWPIVTPKRIRDKMYLALKKVGHPLHFRDIAAEVSRRFSEGKRALSRTVHNELIGDKRFVLVGRGIYALKEWGYQPGVVADIIKEVLRRAGRPLTTKEITEGVLKQRMVKKNTIVANLQNRGFFKKVAKATYTLANSE